MAKTIDVLVGKALSCLISILARPFARVVRRAAETGAGTDACLRQGCLPMPVHYFSPVPDIPDLDRRDVWSRRSPLAGIEFRADAQRALLAAIGKAYGAECRWPASGVDPLQFYTANSCFSYACAGALHCMLRRCRPRRVIEVGSGHSSRVILGALKANQAQTTAPCDYTIIDPYPGEALVRHLPSGVRLVRERVELVDPALFRDLGENDVLFVDSGHTVRIGSDVNFVVLDVLPTLAPGVVVHFHDIPMPYEYPRTYFVSPAFRVFWTEGYLLQAFLACNSEFEILLAMSYLGSEHLEAFRDAFPHFDPAVHSAGSGSLWMRRKPRDGREF